MILIIILSGLVFHLLNYNKTAETMIYRNAVDVVSNIDGEITLLLEREATDLQALRILLPLYEALYKDTHELLQTDDYHPLTHSTSAPYFMDFLFDYLPDNKVDEHLLETLEMITPHFKDLRDLHLTLLGGNRKEKLALIEKIQSTNKKISEILVSQRKHN